MLSLTLAAQFPEPFRRAKGSARGATWLCGTLLQFVTMGRGWDGCGSYMMQRDWAMYSRQGVDGNDDDDDDDDDGGGGGGSGGALACVSGASQL